MTPMALSYRTRLTLACFLANAVSLGVTLSFSSQQQLYIVDVADPPTLSALPFVWVPCLQWTVMHGAAMLPAGLRRTGLPVVVGGSVLCVLARVGASLAQSYASTLLLEGLLTGAAFAMICVPFTGLLDSVTKHDPGQSATSEHFCDAVASSGALAGAVFWSVVKQAMNGAAGVDWTHRIIAIVSAVLLAVAAVAAWGCPPPPSEKAGVAAATEATAPTSRARQPFIWRLALLPGVFCVYAGAAVMPLFLASFVTDREMGESASTSVQTVFYLCGALGHCACSLLDRQLKSKHVFLFAAGISGLLSLAMPVAVSPAVVYVYFGLLGLSFGSLLARPPCFYTSSFLRGEDDRSAVAASCAGFAFGAALCALVQNGTGRGWFSGGFVAAGGLLVGTISLAILLGVEPRQSKGDLY